MTVRNFTFGGMENLSATTQTDNTLHDARAALDFSSDDLVAHELAHQWFGDLLTCRDWSHAWLNEGFATYSEALWKEHSEGRDEFDYLMLQKAAEYMAEPYRRPIVSHRYAYPFQLFDAHLYPKGAWVLHMLRRRVGDELFWRSVRLYLKRHRGGSVETLDLIRCFEQASGKSLQGFFHQWLNCPGHPELEGSLSWDAAAKCVTVVLKQTQKLENGTPVFRLPLVFDARLEDGSLFARTFEMDQAVQTFYLQLPSKPLWVAMDAEGSILRGAKLSVPLEWSEAALTGKTRDARVLARIEAVRQAGAQSAYRAVALLARVLREDPFWGVQLEAAAALGRLQTPDALDALIAGLKVKHPKSRRGVVTALGAYTEPRAIEALRRFLEQPDQSYYVQMSALTSFGRAAGKAAVPALRAELKAAMKRKDWHDLIAQGAAIGLAATRDESVVDDLLALASQPGRYWGTRLNTYHALAELGAARPLLGRKIAEEMVRALDDPDLLLAQRAPGALVSLQQQSAIGALRRKAASSSNAHTRESCLMAAEELSTQASRSEAVDKLQSDFEKLRAEARELRERLDKMSAGRAPVGATTAAGRSAEASARAGRSSVTKRPAGRAGIRGRTAPKEG
ncbi:MAG: HEAT repeat domain-containing protein [Candidatus Eisenbacteria bacterium]|nr:HEAT repeat domain-containing protein [Candidatus Eisenbacteria bacterium]